MGLITKSFEIPLQISVQDFKDRVKAYPLQPGRMKTVPYKMNGFLIQETTENIFLVRCEPQSRRSVRAMITIKTDSGDTKLVARVSQDWRYMIGSFLFLAIGIVASVNSIEKGKIGFAVFIACFGAFPLVLMRLSWLISVGKFRIWLEEGLMKP